MLTEGVLEVCKAEDVTVPITCPSHLFPPPWSPPNATLTNSLVNFGDNMMNFDYLKELETQAGSEHQEAGEKSETTEKAGKEEGGKRELHRTKNNHQ